MFKNDVIHGYIFTWYSIQKKLTQLAGKIRLINAVDVDVSISDSAVRGV